MALKPQVVDEADCTEPRCYQSDCGSTIWPMLQRLKGFGIGDAEVFKFEARFGGDYTATNLQRVSK